MTAIYYGDRWMERQTDNNCNLPAQFKATTWYGNKVFRISGPTKYDIFGKWIKLHNEIQNPCS
jgi:hypothetical protein